jgi:electron transport complex protein RnfA
MGVYLALITTNCAILAVTLNVISYNYNFIESIVYAIGTSGGFLLSLTLMAGVRTRIKIAPVAEFVKGTPVLFITAGLMSLAFVGFAGLIK